MALRLAVEAVLGDADLDLDAAAVAKILAILNSHAPLGAVDPADENAAKAKALAGDDDQFEELRSLLRSAGMSETDIGGAVAIAERARGLPKNALNGGYGGRAGVGMDSARASTFEERHPEVSCIGGRQAPYRRRKIAQDAASTAGAMSFAERHPEASRF